ncbi:GTP 3',8-cyclase MoaA [Lacipirellula sp.]|uniref:GTP 3',8-cyclase MoaA n=1 Tax=Lacipirellula sp. TaxID=2691419 RepID=UPI003D0A041F
MSTAIHHATDHDATAGKLPPLVDSFGRRHTSLRISVTDRCNIRCFYCMPAEGVVFRPRAELLTFEEIERFVRALVPLGLDKLRLTGGEPLLRADLPELVRMLAAIPDIRDLALTTNGMLLDQQAAALQSAGLRRINISLDTLSEATFERITRRQGLDRVLAGIAAAQEAGFDEIRLNAIAIRGLTEDEIIPLAGFARDRKLELRFIEFMPLDAEHHWSTEQVLTGAEIRRVIEDRWGPLQVAPRDNASQPAVDFCFADGGKIGFINPVSEPFCGDCNRLRLTAEGQVRNCLFSTVERDARRVLRNGGSDDDLRTLVRESVAAKAAAHGVGRSDFHQPERAMYQIGG